jgi:hypothetical protein
VKAVAIVHAETSTGVQNPVQEIAQLTHDYGALLVVDAVTSAMAALRLDVRGFCVAPELIHPPRYVLCVEMSQHLESAARTALLLAFDQELKRANVEYRAKRESLRLGDPVLREAPLGAFERERARRVQQGAPDAHLKPPHLRQALEGLDALAPGSPP